MKFNMVTRGVRNVVKCRPGTRIDFERVPGYPLKVYVLFFVTEHTPVYSANC